VTVTVVYFGVPLEVNGDLLAWLASGVVPEGTSVRLTDPRVDLVPMLDRHTLAGIESAARLAMREKKEGVE